MSDQPPESDLSSEFERLGRNLKEAARTAWESEESKKLQAELKRGLSALEAGLTSAAHEVKTGEAGQKIKAEVEDLGQRVRSGQVEQELRKDLLSALRTINGQLQKFTEPKAGSTGPTGPTDDAQS